MIVVRCKHCRKKFTLSPQRLGKPMSCPRCGQTLLVKAPNHRPAPPPADEAEILEESPAADEAEILQEPSAPADAVGELAGAFDEPAPPHSPTRRHGRTRTARPRNNDSSSMLWVGIAVGAGAAAVVAAIVWGLSRNTAAPTTPQQHQGQITNAPTLRGAWVNPAHPSAWDGFGGHSWGTPPQDIPNLQPVSEPGLFKELSWFRREQQGMTIGRAHVRYIDFGFQGDKLVEVRVVCLNSSDRDALMRQVRQTYRLGPPQPSPGVDAQWEGLTSGGYPVKLQFGGRTRAFTATTMRITIEETR